MTLPVTESLVVDSVDTFLILRCPDDVRGSVDVNLFDANADVAWMAVQSYASGYAIYGVWFYPEEDREKILNLLNGYVQAIY